MTQVAAFAQLTGNADQTAYCRNRIKTVLIPNQEAPDGSFPEELRRTKPYGYSLFNLDAMAILVQTLTTKAGQPLDVATARRPRHGEGGGVDVPLHRG